ncbi:MAG: hypothetical protein JXO22_10075 [Phycisphaerae bacterium]|nr:hypothetical protein [Phycisphaerae bacterium]
MAWRGYTFSDVQELSRTEGKLTFVYLRDWTSLACTEFEDTVLLDPDVLAATADLNCVPLQWDTLVDMPLAEMWGIERVPAFVILDSRGRMLQSGQGDVTRERLLEAITRAKAMRAPPAQAQPASPSGTPVSP